ncbi:glycosyltransferase [Pseudofrankia sp. DC12]|uniref:glycosyltransferase n=1 Tax=Pseudofrankia sp. DC12 TaxID=683315 RepID=UPI000A4970CA|nr:glycosyltransferase [Pseudofrankia sp. DC12]
MTVDVSFAHLIRLTDDIGLFEHAEGTVARPEHGYCVDDVARALVVLAREPDPEFTLIRLLKRYLAFVAAAQATNGAVRNRRDADGPWRDRPSLGDWWGRALWGLGTMAVRAPTMRLRATARTRFYASAHRRSSWPRAMTFAALGAGEILLVNPGDAVARALLTDAVAAIGPVSRDPAWPWPEQTLRYANAAVPEALILAGACLSDEKVLADGLRLLEWLLAKETRGGRLSLTPVGGRGPGTRAGGQPGFDQQPIEAAALADACARAYDLTGHPRWLVGLRQAHAWFLGDNDSMVPLVDTSSGGCCDGLERHGRNLNQGAESTLALLSTAQHARRLLSAPVASAEPAAPTRPVLPAAPARPASSGAGP